MDFFISFRAQDFEAARPILSALECRADQLYDWVLFLKVRDVVSDAYYQFPSPAESVSKIYKADCVGAFVKNRAGKKNFISRDEFSCFGAIDGVESYIQICGKFTRPYATETEWVIDFYGELCPDTERRLAEGVWSSRENSIATTSSFDRLLAVLRGSAYRASSSRQMVLLDATHDGVGGAHVSYGKRYYNNCSSENQVHLFGAMWRAWEVTLAPGLLSLSSAKFAGLAVAAYQQRIEAAFKLIRLSNMRSRTPMPFKAINGSESDANEDDEVCGLTNVPEAKEEPRKLVHFFPRTLKRLTRRPKIIVEPPIEADLSWTSRLPMTNFAEIFLKYLNGEKIKIDPDRHK